jgi:hypothetical protein
MRICCFLISDPNPDPDTKRLKKREEKLVFHFHTALICLKLCDRVLGADQKMNFLLF